MENASRDMGSKFIVNNPIVVINKALERRDHFSAFVLACAFLEYLSYVTLRKKGVDIVTVSKRRGDDPSLYELTCRLEKEGIIHLDTRKNIDEIRRVRNKIVHPKGDISKLYLPTEKERIHIETAKECISLLLNY